MHTQTLSPSLPPSPSFPPSVSLPPHTPPRSLSLTFRKSYSKYTRGELVGVGVELSLPADSLSTGGVHHIYLFSLIVMIVTAWWGSTTEGPAVSSALS